MTNVKNESQYALASQLPDGMARQGFLTVDELAVAQRLAVEKYHPSTVWELRWIFPPECGSVEADHPNASGRGKSK